GGVAQEVARLGGGPDVEGAVLRVAGGVGAVGGGGGGEAALGGGHLALQPADGVGDDALAEGGEVVVAAAGGLDGAAGVAAEQERVVVEHLLEVGHDPAGVDGVAGEAAAELVVDAAAGHGAEDVAGDAPGLVGDGPVGLGGAAQQGVDHGGRRELGGGAEAAVAVVGLGGEQADGLVDVGGRDGAWLRGCAAGGELVGDGGGAVEDLLAALLPGLGDGV